MRSSKIHLSLDPTLESHLRNEAAKLNMSLSGYITLLIRKGLDADLDYEEIVKIYGDAKLRVVYGTLIKAVNESMKQAFDALK